MTSLPHHTTHICKVCVAPVLQLYNTTWIQQPPCKHRQAGLWMVLMTTRTSAKQTMFSHIQVLDVGLPHAGELAQQADTGLQQLCVGLHGKSQRHCLKDGRMLSFVLVDVLGHLIAYNKNWCMSAVLANHLGHLIAYTNNGQPAAVLLPNPYA